MGAAQAPSRDHRRFHNAALTRSAINESVDTVGQKNTLLRGDHHGAQGGSKLRPTEENETAYAMMAEEYLDIVNLRWKSVLSIVLLFRNCNEIMVKISFIKVLPSTC